MTEREIFLEALDFATMDARAAYLEDTCGRDTVLRGKVEELLKEHFSNDSLLVGPALDAPWGSVAATSPREFQMIGRYRLLEKIGEGGCGVVYVAEQTEPVRRRVAVKVIKLGMDTKTVVARFEAERQALALMDHPNIAKVLDAGSTETGRPYFVMELVRGRKITEYCDEAKLSTEARLDLFIQVCQAIQHAHQKGIIHRDIKPSNVLVSVNDGAPVPKVIDFGIAKATSGQQLTDKTIYTAFEQFIGTPAYMSPEQALLTSLDIDTRSDIYALGVLLYELLTGQTPFDAKQLLAVGLDEMRRTIREREPPRPSSRLSTLAGQELTTTAQSRGLEAPKLVHQLRGDLDWIVMKCLEKDRKRRYETANGLAADIKRHLANEPVEARPQSAAYKLQKAWQRNKIVFTAAVGVAAALLAGIGVSTWLAVIAIRAKGVAVEARKEAEASRQAESTLRVRAESAEQATRQQLYSALLEQARATMVSGEIGHRVRALDALRRAAGISNSLELRGEVITALTLPDLRLQREMFFPSNANYPSFDQSFERVAISCGDGPVEIRAVSDNRVLATLPSSTNLPAFGKVWSADGRFLAIKRDYAGVKANADWEVWNVSEKKLVLLLHNVVSDTFSFHPKLPRVIANKSPETVASWDLENGREVARFPRASRAVRLSYSPNGDRFAAVMALPGRNFELHDATNPDAPAQVSRLQPFEDVVNSITWHPDGRSLVVADHGGAIYWVDATAGQSELLGRHKLSARSATFTPDGAYFFTGGWERELICWNTRARRRMFTAGLNSSRIAFSDDGRLCAAVTPTSAQLLVFERPAAHREFADYLGVGLKMAAFSPNGRWLVASDAKRSSLWDLSRIGRGAVIANTPDTHFYFTADESEMFGSSALWEPARASRWRLEPATEPTAAPVVTPLPLRVPRGFASLSLISNSVVMTSVEGTQILARSELESSNGVFALTSVGVSGVSRDGQWLGIRQHWKPTLDLYRLPSLEHAARLIHPVAFADFQFSPSGGELMISADNEAALTTVWNTATWERTRVLTNFSRVLYMPDGRGFWVTHNSSRAGLYDTRTTEALLQLPKGMLPIAVSPDGSRLAVSVDARYLQIWEIRELRERLRAFGLDWAN